MESQEVKELEKVIKDFEAKNWGKMATNKDLAKAIIDAGYRKVQEAAEPSYSEEYEDDDSDLEWWQK